MIDTFCHDTIFADSSELEGIAHVRKESIPLFQLTRRTHIQTQKFKND